MRRFTHRYFEFVKSRMGTCYGRIVRCAGPFGCTFVIALPAVLTSRCRSFAAISPTSPDFGRQKQLAARVWLLNAKSVMRWSRSALTSRRDWMVCTTKCTWECHTFVSILTDMFNYWYAQGAIPGSTTKGGKHVLEDLDDYRPITLPNTKLKILARVLANRFQLVISNLIGPEQNYAGKGRSIQDSLHLVRVILEGLKDDTEADQI